mgnify:CR=1 FL=1
MIYSQPIEQEARDQRYRVQRLVGRYASNPMSFSPSQVDELKNMAEAVGVEMPNRKEEFDVRRNAKNLMGGFIEGMTTIPTGTKPKTTYEAISHSMGHLAGFAPGIMAHPLGAIGSALGKTRYGKVAKLFTGAAKGAQKLNKYSVPMFFGHKATGLMNKGLQKSGLESAEFLKKGSAGRGVLEEATTLGVASGVSAIWKGPDVMWDSVVHGGIAGGMFGGLGNFTAIGNYLKSSKTIDHVKGEQMLKGVVGAGMLGIPAYLRDDPIEMVIYETMLGGYFGYNARPAVQKEGGEFIRDLQFDESSTRYAFRPERHPEWNRYSKGAKEYINKQVDEYTYKYIVPKMMESSGMSERQVMDNFYKMAQARYDTKKPTEEQIKSLVREEADQYWTFRRKGYRMDWKDVSEEYNMQYDTEDIYQDVVVAASAPKGKEKTPLDIVRNENQVVNEVYIAEYHQDGTVTFVRKKGNYGQNTLVGENTFGKTPAQKLETGEYITMDHIFVANLKDNKGNDVPNTFHKTLKPLKYRLEDGMFVREIDTAQNYAIYDALRKEGKYIFGGIKDKGVYTLRDYHIDVDLVNRDAMFKALSGNDPVKERAARESYNEGLAIELEWLGKKNTLKDMSSVDMSSEAVKNIVREYNKQWKSNVLAEAERMGYYTLGTKDLSNINNLMNKGHSKDVIDWNKRQQLYQDKSLALNKDAVNENGQRIFEGLGNRFQYQIFEDINIFDQYYRKGKDGKPELANYESWTDGIVVIRPEIYDRIAQSIGLPKSNMLKPVISVKLENGGVMVVKSAGQRASNKADKNMIDMMNAKGLDMVIFTSAAKHYGNEKPLDIGFDSNTGKYSPGDINPLSMPIDSVRVNLGTVVDPKRSTKSQRVVSQLGSALNERQAPGAQKLFYEEVLAGGPKGTQEAVNVIERYRQTGDKTELNKLDIDDIPTRVIHEIFTKDADITRRTERDADLAKIIARKISKMDKEGGLNDIEDVVYNNFSKEEYAQYIYRNNKMLDSTDFDMVYRHNFDASSKYFDNVYKKYIISRYVKPKWKYSGKSWLGGVLPHNQVDPKIGGWKIKSGEIKLDNGMGDMKIKITDRKGNLIEETTLWKGWNKYKNKKEYEHNFELTAVRVPMDSISGARVLKFTGFTNSKGHSARTHAKDDWYLGGADKDSDSVFIYQGFSEKLKKVYKDKANEWGEGTKEKPMVEKKSEEMDALFGIDVTPSSWSTESFFNPFSQFNPSMRKVVADQAYKGTNTGLGYGLKGKEAVNELLDLVPKSGMAINIKTGKGENDIGTLTLKPKENAGYNVRRLGMEIVNRSADSANYPVSRNAGEYRNMLLEAGFDAKITRHDGKVVKAKYKDVAKHFRNIQLQRLNNPIVKGFEGKSITLEQWQASITKELAESTPNESLSYLTSKRMEADGIFNNTKPYSAKLEEFALAMQSFRDFIISDPFNRRFALLGKIAFDPNMAVKQYQKDLNNPRMADDFALTKYEFKIMNDMFAIGTYRALTKQGNEIHKYMRDVLELKPKKGESIADTVIVDVLRPLNARIQQLKQKMDNIKKRVKDGEFQEGSYVVEAFEAGIRDIDLLTLELTNRYVKRFNADKDVLFKMFKDYTDIALIGNLRPFGGKGGPEMLAIQSQQIQNSALKKILMSHGNIFKAISQKSLEKQLVTDEKVPYYLKDVKEYYKSDNPNQVITKIVNKIDYKKPEYTVREEMSPTEIAEAAALNSRDYEAIKEFESNLKKNKNVADNFDAWFMEFTNINEGGIRRDVSTFTMKDVYNFNRWFKDIDRRFLEKGKGLPPYAWRVDPRYMNEQMALYEGKVFASYEAPVKTSDGVVVKRVKNFTGSLGMMRDMFRRTNMQIDKYSALDLAQNERLYKFRKQLTKEQAHGINEIVIAKREGENLSQNKWYKKLKNEIFIYEGKTRTMEEMVEIVDRIYTKDFENFGNKWLWGNESVKTEYFKYGADGKLNINNFLRKLTGGLDKGLDLPQIGLENLLRFQYEYKMEKILTDNLKGSLVHIGKKTYSPKEFRELYREGRLKFSAKFKGIDKYNYNEYFPHMWENTTRARQAEVDAYIKEQIERFRNDPEMQQRVEAMLRKQHELAQSETGGADKHIVDDIVSGINYKNMTDAQIANHLNNIGFFNRPGSSLERTTNKPGWDRDLNTIDLYKDKFIRSYYKNLQSILVNNRIDSFVKDNAFGNYTKDWADYLRIYARDAFGHQSTFEQRIVDNINASSKKGERGSLGLGNSLYYRTSDHRIIKAVEYIDKKFAEYGMKVPFFKNIPKITAEKGTEAYNQQVQARREYLSRMIHNFGKMEAKFNLMTLLANTGTMTANLFGAASMSISQGGLKNFGRSYNSKWLKQNLLTDTNGNYILNYTDPATGKMKSVTNKKELRQWAAEQGIIDKFIADEIGVNLALKTGLKGRNAKSFVKELSKILRKNPDASNETVLELARRYGVQSSIEKTGAWFMQKSERIARTDAFLTHAIQFKERWGAMGHKLRLDDPAVIDYGLKGVEATQFLYHSAFRPAYMRTSLGKVLTRFKLFAFQSVRTRKEFYRQAKHYGFEEGTPAFERFKNLFMIDMFTMALGTAFAYSLFDTALPPPYDWIQETGEWLFGNKRERDRAFFGQWPYPVAPLQVATPPIARIPMAAFSSLINNDWERFADYHIHTMYPFGRMVRQVDKTFDEPYGTTFGRGMQQFFRLPTDKLVSKFNKAEIEKKRKEMIDAEIQELGELI